MDRIRAAITDLATRTTPGRWDARDLIGRLREVNVLVVVIALLVSSTAVVTAVQTRATASVCPTGLSGAGTVEDPCLVTDADDLNKVREALGAHYRQTANITLSGTWTPIGFVPEAGGTAASTSAFTGSYDGRVFGIDGLEIRAIAGLSNYGLFADVDPAAGGPDFAVRNLKLTNVDIDVTAAAGSSLRVGALAGRIGGTAEIRAVSVEGAVDVTFSASYSGTLFVGGVVGQTDNSSRLADRVSFRGTMQVAGTNNFSGSNVMRNVGGIVGRTSSNSAVSLAYSQADISVTGTPAENLYVGTAIGSTSVGASVVQEMYSIGSVPASDGKLYTGAIGEVAASGDQVIEFYIPTGLNAVGRVTASSWPSENDGFVELTEAQMKGAAAATNMTGAAGSGRWDFESVWATVTEPEYPADDFPIFLWETVPAGTAAPSAPGTPTATVAGTTATVSWPALEDEQFGTPDGSAVTITYTVTANPERAGATCSVTTTASDTDTELSCDITGLQPEVTTTFTVTAANAAGTGPASPSSDPVTATRLETISIGAPSAPDPLEGSTVIVPVTLSDFPTDRSYEAFVSIPSSRGELTLGTTTGLTAIYGYGTTTFQRSGGRELGFSGAYADVAAALASLRFTPISETANPATELTVTVNEAPSGSNAANIFFFPGNGHYYEYVNTGSAITWTAARDAAAQRTLFGRTGYLATITSLEESTFVSTLIDAPNIWIGATDDFAAINSGVYEGTTQYANQAASEGKWYWVTGPADERVQFWGATDVTKQWKGTRNSTEGTGFRVDGRFEAWRVGEPNNDNSASEHYAGANFNCVGVCSATENWNDFRNDDSSVRSYLVEYGGLGEPLDAVSATASRFIVSGAPNSLVPTVVGAGEDRQVKLTWAEPASGAPSVTGYEYSLDGGTSWTSTGASTLSTRTITLDLATSTPIRDNLCFGGTLTNIRVRALIGAQPSAFVPATRSADCATASPTLTIGLPALVDGTAAFAVPVTPTGFDTSVGYSAFVSVPEGTGALTLGTTDGLSPAFDHDATTFQRNGSDGARLGFIGTYADVAAALASVRFTPTGGAPRRTELTVTLTERPATANTDNIFFNPDNGHYYEFVSGSFTWAAARAAAESRTLFGMTGYLATITSLEESTFVLRSIVAPNIWIGATDFHEHINEVLPEGTPPFANQAASEGRWYWVTGPEAGQQFWEPVDGVQRRQTTGGGQAVDGRFSAWVLGQEPNNSGGSEHGAGANFDCNRLTCTSTSNWNDFPLARQQNFVVEYGGTPGQASTAVTATATTHLVTSAPRNLTAAPSDDDIVLQWSAPTFGADRVTGYEYSLDGGATWTATGTTPATATTATVSDLTGGDALNPTLCSRTTLEKVLVRALVADTGASGTPSEGVVAARGGDCAQPRIFLPTPMLVDGETDLFDAPVTLSGFDELASYNVFMSVPSGIATLDMSTKDDLEPVFGYMEETLRRGDFELGFSGAYDDIVAALATLQVTRLQELASGIELKVTVSEAPSIPDGVVLSYFPDNGHYYEYVNTGAPISWTAARDAAEQRSVLGLRGYLVTITSPEESNFVTRLIEAPNIWIGATDDTPTIASVLGSSTRTITQIGRAGTTVTVSARAHGYRVGDRVLLSGLTGSWAALNGEYGVASVVTSNTFTVTSAVSGTITAGDGGGAGRVQASFEGRWHWVTGPEAGQEFWRASDVTKQWKGLRSGVQGTGARVSDRYEAWRVGEPNNAGSTEHFAAANFNCVPNCVVSANWNDFSVGNTSVRSYLVEYGGLPGEQVTTLTAQTTRVFAERTPITAPDVVVYDPATPLPDGATPGVRGEDWDVIDGKLVVYTDPVFITEDDFQAALDDPTNPLTDIDAGTFSGDGDFTIPEGQTLRIDTSEDSTYSGDISGGGGGGGLIKDGPGGLTLDGDNSDLTGSITVAEGDLTAGSDDAFGTGPINVLPGGNLAVEDGVTIADLDERIRPSIPDADVVVYDADAPLPLDENGDPITPSIRGKDWDVVDGKLVVFTDPVLIPHDEFQAALDDPTNPLTEIEAGTFSGDGPIEIPDGQMLTIDTSRDGSVYSGDIYGGGGLVKEGEGDLTLSGENTYSGGTVVAEGELLAGTRFKQADPDADVTIVADGTDPKSIRGTDWDVIDGQLIVYNSPANITCEDLQAAIDDPTNPLTDIDVGTFSGDQPIVVPEGQALTIETSETSTYDGSFSGGGTVIPRGETDLTGDLSAVKQADPDADVTIVADGTDPKSIRGTDWDVIDGQLIVYNSPANITREDLQAAIDDPTNPLTDIDVGTFSGDQPIVVPEGQALTIETSETSTYDGSFSGGGTVIPRGETEVVEGSPFGTGDITVAPGAELIVPPGIVIENTVREAVPNADITVVEGGGSPRGVGWDVIDGKLVVFEDPISINGAALQAALDDPVNPLTIIEANTFSGDQPLEIPNGRTLTIDTDSTSTYSGDISGGGGLIKKGEGDLTLSGDNSYSGGTVIAEGELTAGSDTAFGTGTITVAPDGELDVPAGITITNTVREPIADADVTVVDKGGSPRGEGWDVIDGKLVVYVDPISINRGALQAAIDDPVNPLLEIEVGTFNGDQPLRLHPDRALTIDTSKDGSVYSGPISGGGPLIKEGPGDLTLSGDNSFSGGVIVNGGDLVAGRDSNEDGSRGPFGSGTVIVGPGASLDTAGRTVRNPVTVIRARSEAPAAGPSFTLRLSPSSNLAIGSTAEILVEGGPADFEVLWRASYNPVFAVGVAKFDADGRATISFVVPRAAYGRPILLEFVDWTEPMMVGIAVGRDGNLRPVRINAGGGPVPLIPLPMGLLIVLLAGFIGVIERERRFAEAIAMVRRQHLRRSLPGRRLPGFDALQSRVEELRETIRRMS